MTEVRPAATVIVVRPAGAGIEVFLARRTGAARFMPTMWVFPGGRVDPADHEAALHARGGTRADAFGLPWARAGLVAAARETLEEAGLWLGEGTVDEAARAEVTARPAALAEGLASGRWALHLDRLLPWARWVTPEEEPRRFDTLFLVARAPPEAAGRHDGQETVDSAWVDPRAVLDGGLADWPVAPPTFWALAELAACRDVGGVEACIGRRDLRPIQPVRAVVDDRLSFCLPGDPRHPEPAREGLPWRLALDDGRWQVIPAPT